MRAKYNIISLSLMYMFKNTGSKPRKSYQNND